MSTDSNPEMYQHLRAALKTALQEFISSSSSFRILRSIPEKAITPCSTLYVLDSSFNPPSKAHTLLAENALCRDNGKTPVRLLLLLATVNADKAVKPAAFEDRIAMMTLMAHSLYESTDQIPVDIGVTKKPFFVDKAKSIDDSETYGNAEQVHLIGFDTITRIFNSKYYPEDQKLRVLDPFLTKHRLRANYRVGDEYGDRASQDKYLEGITDGSRVEEGMNPEWRDRIDMVDDAEDGAGVSSTQARKAVVAGNPDQLREFVLDDVAKYVTTMKLYLDSDAES